MKWNKVFFFITLAALFCSCFQNNNGNGIAVERSIYLDVDSMQAKDVSFYDLCKEVECITLDDSSPEYLLNADYIMDVSDSMFCFLDYKQTGDVFIFDSKGKWVKRLGKIGRGHGEYLMASDFAVNESNGTLDVLDPTGYILQYDLHEFKFKNKVSIPDEIVAPQSFCYQNGRYILYTPYDDCSAISVISINDGKWFRLGRAMDRVRTKLTSGNFNLFAYKDTIRFFDSYDGAIYLIDCENRLSNTMVCWNFGKRSPYNFKIEAEESSLYYMNWIKQNQSECVIPFTKACEGDNFILMSFGYKGHTNVLRYDKSTSRCSPFYRTSEGVRISVGVINKGYMYALVRPELLGTYVNDRIEHKNCSNGYVSNYIVLKYKLNE